MADPFITKLNAISAPGTSVATFFKKLGPIHGQWHSANNQGTVSIGFLLFHWELIQRFKSVGGPAHFGGITPFTTAQFTQFGQPYNVTTPVHANDLNSLEQFSHDLENWHNNAHMAIGMAFHVNMMAPKTNIKLMQFWQLHYFINAQFEHKLANYQAGVAVPTVIAQLEASPAIALV